MAEVRPGCPVTLPVSEHYSGFSGGGSHATRASSVHGDVRTSPLPTLCVAGCVPSILPLDVAPPQGGGLIDVGVQYSCQYLRGVWNA